jgi:trehalose/maltose hydrolase-like predicted phosphorylase
MRLFRHTASLASLLATSVSASTSTELAQFDNVTWDDNTWTLSTSTLNTRHYQSRLSLANGYFGISVSALGPFFETDAQPSNPGNDVSGWPLFTRRQAFSSIAGFYNNEEKLNGTNYPWLEQYGWDSVVAGIPHWSGLHVEVDGHILNASTNVDEISNFESSLNVQTGVANWGYTWREIDIRYEMWVHKLFVSRAAVKVWLTAERDMNITVWDVLVGEGAVRTEAIEAKREDSITIRSVVRPKGVKKGEAEAHVVSTLCAGGERLRYRGRDDGRFGEHESTIANGVDVHLPAGQTREVTKFVGVASGDAFEDPGEVALVASLGGVNWTYEDLLEAHIAEWKEILTPDFVDSYRLPNGDLPSNPDIQQLHILAHTNPFYLLSHMVGPNAIAEARAHDWSAPKLDESNNTRLDIASLPVCGFASDCYGGQIFWDADVWMAPGIQVSHPRHAQKIIKYRVDKFEQAQRNVETAFTSSKNQSDRFTSGGAVFPWTSGRWGNCTGTGACWDYEYHLNGDISLSFNNHLIITGDGEYFNNTLLPISNAVAHFFGQVLDFNESSGAYELWNATDPDEYANQVNNAGYTTALIQRHLIETNEFNAWFGLPQNASWADKAAKMKLPVNENVGIIVEYTGMNGSVEVKQADVVLVDDLLHYPNPYSLANLDYYAAKQSLDGPAMTYSSFAVVANEVSPSGCSSLTYNLYSSAPYARAPWYQYSEQLIDDPTLNGGTHPAFPFLTGMGGTNRVAIFGYLGLGLYYESLDIDPSLPPQIEYLNYRTFYWHGHAINATSNTTHTTLARLPIALPTANTTYFTSPIPVTVGTRSNRANTTYLLTFSSPLVIENRPIGQTLTVARNILQCGRLVDPVQDNMPGQFPLAAIDGAASTKWQSVSSHTTSWLTVDLGVSEEFYEVDGVLLDWAKQPPTNFTVAFTNTSLPPFRDGDSDARLVTQGNVTISAPWDSATAFEIKTYVGNQTNVTLEERVWSGRYVHLGVRGNQFREGRGATVAEWSVLRVEEGEERVKMGEQERMEL